MQAWSSSAILQHSHNIGSKSISPQVTIKLSKTLLVSYKWIQRQAAKHHLFLPLHFTPSFGEDDDDVDDDKPERFFSAMSL